MALEVTASKTRWRIGEEAPYFTPSGATGGIVWTTSRGSLTDTAEPVLSMPNQSWYGAPSIINGNEAVVITATDDAESVSVSVDVFATFPYQADWGFQSPIDEDTEISKAEDNNESYRILSDLFSSWPMVFKDREHDEFIQAQIFRAFHGKTRWFYIDEKGLEELQYVRFDSPFLRAPDWADGKTYGFTLYSNVWQIPSTGLLGEGGGLFGEIIFGEGLFGG